MARPMKVYGGNHSGRFRMIVAASSIAEFMRLTGISRDYCDGDTLNPEEVRVAMERPGVVFRRLHTARPGSPWEEMHPDQRTPRAPPAPTPAPAPPLPEMTPERIAERLAVLRWSFRQFSEALGTSEKTARLWLKGTAPMPPRVAEWLESVSAAVEAIPAPVSGRVPGRRGPTTGGGFFRS